MMGTLANASWITPGNNKSMIGKNMALVKCRECGKEISSETKICPNCGAKQKKKMGFFKKTLLGLLGIFVVLLIIGSMADKPALSSSGAVAAADAPAFAFETSPTELANAYEENTVAADSRFKGKKFKVTGVVESINTDFGDGVYVTMRGGNPFMQPQFALLDSEKSTAGSLKKGQSIALICTGGGDVAKIPMSKRCTFAR